MGQKASMSEGQWFPQSWWLLLALPPLGFTTWAVLVYLGIAAKRIRRLVWGGIYFALLVTWLQLTGPDNASTGRQNLALTSAVDDSGRTILRFGMDYSIKPRQGRPRLRMTLLGLPRPKLQGVEIDLSPGLKTVPELLLIAVVASPWISGPVNSGGADG
jgi:hypothetical protein